MIQSIKFILTFFLLSLPMVRADEVSTQPVLIEPTPAPEYRLGFVAALAAPQPILIGLEAIPNRNPDLAYFFQTGYFIFSSSGVKGQDLTIEVGAKYKPFSNWFFFGLEAGYWHIDGADNNLSNVAFFKADGNNPIAKTLSVSMNSFFVGAITGGEWPISSQVTFGFYLGVQFPFVAWGDMTGVATDPQYNTYIESPDSLRRLAGIPLPQIALARFKWDL